MKSFRPILLLLVVAALFAFRTPLLMAQSATTGALTGTVTDPTGAVIAGATVTITNLGTEQARTATTDANGSYKFSLIPPGNYSATFSASGFKGLEVPSVTVNVTETDVLNRGLQIGEQTQQVTVKSDTETIQTQNATVGSLVGAKTVTTLPLNSRNYTQVIDLSPGVNVNVANAAAIGNGTQDINVNGNGSDQNNYMMDGATITNYSTGAGAQSGSLPGIGIPNPDTIQEFKIQTSQYDAEYGRNPGASVNVVTKSGTNNFHGDAWEFFRNTALDANDFFNKFSEARLESPNKPQILDENIFGGTIGGPIKKNKLFFFGSYQGLRQKNGIGNTGSATGLSTGVTLLPFSEPDGTRNDEVGTIPLNLVPGNPACNYATYRGYLGCVFAGSKGFGTHVTIGVPDQSNPLNDATTNINNVAVNFLRVPGTKSGLNAGFLIPSVPFKGGLPIENCWTDASCRTNVISDPVLANENQYLANFDYVINQKNTLSERFFTSTDPQVQPFESGSGSYPGAPTAVTYTSDSGTLKLTTVVTPNLVNEASFSFQRQTDFGGTQDWVGACAVQGFVQPLTNPQINPGGCASVTGKGINTAQLQIPTISTVGVAGLPNEGGWESNGSPLAANEGFWNYFQGNEQLSWNHGKHSIRAGFWLDHIQYDWALPGRGSMTFDNTADFLTSSSGAAVTGTAAAPGGLSRTGYGLANPNGNAHEQHINELAAFVQDDIRVTRKLTLNLGVRWEYDGYPSEVNGLLTNAWTSVAGIVNTGSFFLGQQATNAACGNGAAFGAPGCQSNQIGTLAGYVVQSNYNPNAEACGNPLALSACGLSAPAGVFPANPATGTPAYPGGATGVYFNTNKTLVHGAPLGDFAPRFGLAWQPLGNRLVIRAGYGIFYDAVDGKLLTGNQAGDPPYSGSVLQTPINSTDNPDAIIGLLGWTPRTLQVLTGTPSTGATLIEDNRGSIGVASTSDSEFLGVPLVQQYNLDVQYEVASNWTVDVGYVGSHGAHLYSWNNPINVSFLAPNAPNEPTDAQNSRMIIGSGAQGTPNTFAFNDPNNTNPAARVVENTANNPYYGPASSSDGNYLGRVSYLGYGANGMSTTGTVGDALYDSLQAQLKHQFTNGLLLQVSYTWSKLITNVNASSAGTGISATGNVLASGSGSNDPLDMAQQYGLAAFNRPQRLIIAYSYDLPYKRRDGLAGHVLGGWTVSGITTIQDGEPLSVTDTDGGTIYYGPGGTSCTGCNIRAQLLPANTGKCNSSGVCGAVGVATSGSTTERVVSKLENSCAAGWINQTAFGTLGTPSASSPCGAFTDAIPCIGGTVVGSCATSGGGTGFGDSGVGIVMGPGQHNWDLSLIKNTKVTEGTSLEFRTEFYNIWNHPQFNQPTNSVVTTSTFGLISSSSVPPRIMQFALKYYF
jgi:hypothetical protein